MVADRSAREDFRTAVREAATYRSSDLGGPGTAGYLLAETQFAAIFEAAEAYVSAAWRAAWDKGTRHALRSLAADLEAEAGNSIHDVTAGTFRTAAQMARRVARSAQEPPSAPAPVAQDPGELPS